MIKQQTTLLIKLESLIPRCTQRVLRFELLLSAPSDDWEQQHEIDNRSF